MTTTATTPAKKAAAPVKATKPALDLGSLKVEAADAPKRSGGRTAGENPLVAEMQDSWANRKFSHKVKTDDGTRDAYIGSGKQVTVPLAHKQAVTNLIRNAANRLDLGSAIDYTDVPGGKVRIRFAAKSRKQKRDKS